MSAAAAPTPAASSALAAIARAEMAPSIEVTYCGGFQIYICVRIHVYIFRLPVQRLHPRSRSRTVGFFIYMYIYMSLHMCIHSECQG